MNDVARESGVDKSVFSGGAVGDRGKVEANLHDPQAAAVAVVEGKPDTCCDSDAIDSTGRGGDAREDDDDAKRTAVARVNSMDVESKHLPPPGLPPSASPCTQLDTPRDGLDAFASLGAPTPRHTSSPPPQQQQQQQQQQQHDDHQEHAASAVPAPAGAFGSNADSVVERWAPVTDERPAASTAAAPISPREPNPRASANPASSSTTMTMTINKVAADTEVAHDSVAERCATPESPSRREGEETCRGSGRIRGSAGEETPRARDGQTDEGPQVTPSVPAEEGRVQVEALPTDLPWRAGEGGMHEATVDTVEAGGPDEVFSSINPLFVGGGACVEAPAGVGCASKEGVEKEVYDKADHACSEEGDTTPASSAGDSPPPPPASSDHEGGEVEEGVEEETALASGPVAAPIAAAAADAAAPTAGVDAADDFFSPETSPSDGGTVYFSTAGESSTGLPLSPSSLSEGGSSPFPDSEAEQDRVAADEARAYTTSPLGWRGSRASAWTSASEDKSSSGSIDMSVFASSTSCGSGGGGGGGGGGEGAFLAIPVAPVLLDAQRGGGTNVDDHGGAAVGSSLPSPQAPEATNSADRGSIGISVSSSNNSRSSSSIISSSKSSPSDGLRVFARVRSSARGGASAVARLLRRRAKVAAAVRAPMPPAPDASVADQGPARLPPPPPEAANGGGDGGGSGGIARKLPVGFPPYAELFRGADVAGDKLWAAKGCGGGDGGGGGGVLPELTGHGTEKSGVEPVGRKAPRPGSREIPGKTPLVSPLCSSPPPLPSSPAASANSSSSGAMAAAEVRVEVEGDVEEGGAAAARPEAGAAARVGVAGEGEAAAAAAVVAADDAAEGIVLPCAPSDEEKVLYYDSGRFGLVACALVAFLALSWGMWLFTIVMPAFYWFGVPAAFLVFYTAAHYIGVAMWGKDFEPDDHAAVVRRSGERGYQPTVDVFLPVCKEPLHLLANTWKHVSALDYPSEKINVFVLDDGASEPVRDLAAAFGFEYVLRDNVPELKKAGNLRNAFARTSGEAVAIFDADFCPRSDFLKETTPYLGEDPTIGIVQTPQFFRLREEQTWIEQGAGVSQEFFYRLVQMNQDRFNAAVCVGSCGLYRRTALAPLGGMAAIEHSEDMYTGYKMTEHGFKIKYVPLALAMGICPDEPHSFFMQQYRWCKGSATLVTKREFWRSDISNLHKLCFLNGMLYYVATALLVFVAPLPILLLVWVAADGVLWYHSAFVLPAIVFAVVIMPLWSKQRYGMACHRTKIIQCYAHMFAIKDALIGRSAPWIPSGHGGRLSSSAYISSVRLMVAWNVIATSLIVGGSVWRMTELTWYHFLPAVVLAVGSFVLNMSTLVY